MIQAQLWKVFTKTFCRNGVSQKIFGIFFLFFCLSAVTAQAADIGKVTILVPGVSVTRSGQAEELRQHAPLRVSDTVHTDATGRVRILFNDDSMVDMGANTSLDMRDFADSGTGSAFNVHLLQGVARVITGKIVEQNPSGFAVTTPEVSIGIRGTILSVRSSNGVSTVYVENTTRAVHVNNIHVPGGQKITIPSDSLRPEPIVPQDRRDLGRDLAFRGGAGVAAAAPEPLRDNGQIREQPKGGTTHLVTQANLIPPGSALTDIALGVQTLGDALTGNGGLSVTPTTASYAYSGAPVGFTALNFGFRVNLGSGAISSGYMNGSGAMNGAFNITGGTGSVATAIQGFTGTAHHAGNTGIWLNPGFTPGAAAALVDSVIFTDPSFTNTDAAGPLSAPKVP